MVLRAVSLALVVVLSGPAVAGVAGGPAVAAPRPATQARAEPAEPVKWYRVRPSYDGQPEYLFEIAERFLGDGDRFDEIFALNRGRPQLDGSALTVPDEVEAGWVLQLPDDADGPGLEYGPLPTAAPSAPAAATTGPATPAPAAAPPDDGTNLLPVLLGAGVLLIVAGAGLGVLVARRRRTRRGPVVIPQQRTGGTPKHDVTAAWTIDRALRVLVTSAADAGRPVPPVSGVSVDESWLALRLDEPDDPPFPPWEARESGRLWIAPLRALQALPADQHAAAVCPRLVTLGTHDGTRELLDLGRVPGPVGLRGDPAATRALLAAWAAELTGSPWSTGVRVVAGGLLPEIADDDRVQSLRGLDEAVDLAAGAPATPDDGWLSVLLLGAAPAGRDADRVRDLAERPGRPWAVVVLGRTRADHRRLTLHPDGRLDTGLAGLTVHTTVPATTPRPA